MLPNIPVRCRPLSRGPVGIVVTGGQVDAANARKPSGWVFGLGVGGEVMIAGGDGDDVGDGGGGLVEGSGG